MANGRAKKGGETGMNGEFYPGGTFLPSTTLGKMAASKKKAYKPFKNQVAPYVWEIVPEGMKAIFSSLMGFAGCWDHKTNKMALYLPVVENDYNGLDKEGCQKLVDKFNSGEKFCTQEEYRMMWKQGFTKNN